MAGTCLQTCLVLIYFHTSPKTIPTSRLQPRKQVLLCSEFPNSVLLNIVALMGQPRKSGLVSSGVHTRALSPFSALSHRLIVTHQSVKCAVVKICSQKGFYKLVLLYLVNWSAIAQREIRRVC